MKVVANWLLDLYPLAKPIKCCGDNFIIRLGLVDNLIYSFNKKF